MKTAPQELSPSVYTRLTPQIFNEVKRRAAANERSISSEIRFLVKQAIEGNAEAETDETAVEPA